MPIAVFDPAVYLVPDAKANPNVCQIKVWVRMRIRHEDEEQGFVLIRLVDVDEGGANWLAEEKIPLNGRKTGDSFVRVSVFVLSQDVNGNIVGELGSSGESSCQLAIQLSPDNDTSSYGTAIARSEGFAEN